MIAANTIAWSTLGIWSVIGLVVGAILASALVYVLRLASLWAIPVLATIAFLFVLLVLVYNPAWALAMIALIAGTIISLTWAVVWRSAQF